MKQLKFLILGLCCAVAASLSSCLKTEEDDTVNGYLTREELNSAFAAVRGNYSGVVLYQATNPDDPKDVEDTVSVNWTVNADTMLVVHNFPIAAVAEFIRDAELKEALLNEYSFMDLTCYLGFVYCKEYVQFLIGPKRLDLPIYYKNATHTLNIAFWTTSISSGVKYTTGEMTCRLVAGGVYLDEKTETNYLGTNYGESAQVPIYITNQDLSASAQP